MRLVIAQHPTHLPAWELLLLTSEENEAVTEAGMPLHPLVIGVFAYFVGMPVVVRQHSVLMMMIGW